MSLPIGPILKVVLKVIRNPLFHVFVRELTKGKNPIINEKVIIEKIANSRPVQEAVKKGGQVVEGAIDATMFNPKNPHHYRPEAPDSYNPFAVRFKALKSACVAARDAIKDVAAGRPPTYNAAPYAAPKKPTKPITKPDRIIDV